MRGKLYRPAQAVSGARITPADAGKTLSWRNNPLPSRHHPRGCGENLLRFTVRRADIGSPPQVRGKLASSSALLRGLRITPAGAGKTISTAGYENNGMDHPRRCGENAPFLRRTVRRPGSPPQVRGKPSSLTLMPNGLRITPAGAGKTAVLAAYGIRTEDHPRRCGENQRVLNLSSTMPGSPPQVRGKRTRNRVRFFFPWITPAGAGKTYVFLLLFVLEADHPRRCGENIYPEYGLKDETGSPPQVRGKLCACPCSLR